MDKQVLEAKQGLRVLLEMNAEINTAISCATIAAEI
jgi:hypothetical protein